ncbi:MAG: hypothetical protein GY847_37525 [Proteobacteria bacterium]|nr:hypothetical protein [Pseudomonadota bacterium]
MSDKQNDEGWVNRPTAPLADNIDGDQPTRIAPCDLLAKEAMLLKQEREAKASEATVIKKHFDSTDKGPQYHNAEFVPPSGQRRIGEVTIPWSKRDRLDVEQLLKKMASLGKGIRHHRRLLFLIAFMSAAAIATIGFAGNGGVFKKAGGESLGRAESSILPAVEVGTESIDHPGDNIVKADNDRAIPSTQPMREMEDIPSVSDENRPKLKSAADALIEGRLDEALAIYRQLKILFPDNESYALAVDILQRSKKGAMK